MKSGGKKLFCVDISADLYEKVSDAQNIRKVGCCFCEKMNLKDSASSFAKEEQFNHSSSSKFYLTELFAQRSFKDARVHPQST